MGENKEWWMPYKEVDDDGDTYLNWLCDHLGDASEVMDKLWEEICKHRKDLPPEGFESDD